MHVDVSSMYRVAYSGTLLNIYNQIVNILRFLKVFYYSLIRIVVPDFIAFIRFAISSSRKVSTFFDPVIKELAGCDFNFGKHIVNLMRLTRETLYRS